MFGADMMNKLVEMKKLAEESKQKLRLKTLTNESGGGLIEVTMNGNRELLSLKINTDLKTMDPEHLENLISIALNKVLTNVDALIETENINSTKNLFPDL